jgi:hypothetical protein
LCLLSSSSVNRLSFIHGYSRFYHISSNLLFVSFYLCKNKFPSYFWLLFGLLFCYNMKLRNVQFFMQLLPFCVYGFFYYLPLLSTLILIIKNMKHTREQKFPISIRYLFYGQLSLIFPVAIAFTLLALGYVGLRDSIESILCKFAFLYCMTLVYFALSNKQRSV